MTVKDELYFTYDGKSSDDLGIINVSIEEVWVDEPFLATAEISNVNIKGRDKPYFMGITRQPLRLNLTFAFAEGWDEDLIQEVAMLFHTDYYKPLSFSENEDRVFYCMYSGDPRILHYKLKQGYIEMELVCNDICAYSRVKEQTFTGSSLVLSEDGKYHITFSNRGNLPIYPEIILDTKSDPTLDEDGFYDSEKLSIHTTEEFKVNSLEPITITVGEETVTEALHIDGENEVIESNTQLYRYNNHNGVFLKMVPGRNNLVINNTVDSIKFRWQFKLLQG